MSNSINGSWKNPIGTIKISRKKIEQNLMPDKFLIEQVYKTQIKQAESLLMLNVLLDEILGIKEDEQ